MSAPDLDRLTGQLYNLPDIIGRMGLSVAAAQKAFNADYLLRIMQLMEIIKGTVGGVADDDARLAAMRQLIETLAPSRHQFTEATIDFSADLAETMNVGGQAGLGVNAAAFTVNAAFALSYGYDYRAAARITAKLHAIPANPEISKALLARAKEIDAAGLALPAPAEVDKQIAEAMTAIFAALAGDQGNGGGGG
jgi:hypothetical protein